MASTIPIAIAMAIAMAIDSNADAFCSFHQQASNWLLLAWQAPGARPTHVAGKQTLLPLLLPLASITTAHLYLFCLSAGHPPTTCLYRLYPCCHWPAHGHLHYLLALPSRGPTCPSPPCASRPADVVLGASPHGAWRRSYQEDNTWHSTLDARYS